MNSSQALDLLDRLLNGDETARNELNHAGYASLEAMSKMLKHGFPGVARWEETGDILSETVLRFLNKQTGWDHVSSTADLIRWFKRKTRDVLIEKLRHYFGPEGEGANHTSAQFDDSSRNSAMIPIDDSNNPERLAEWTEVHTAINALPDDQWDVFDLHYYQEKQWEDIANELKISISTAMRCHHKALQHLQRTLKRNLPGLTES